MFDSYQTETDTQFPLSHNFDIYCVSGFGNKL